MSRTCTRTCTSTLFSIIFSLLLTIDCASPRLLSLVAGDEATDYGFFPLSPVPSYDDFHTLKSSPKFKVRDPPPSIAYPIEDNCAKTTRSRRNTVETASIDLESGEYQVMSISSSAPSSPKSVAATLIRRYCCFCFPDAFLSCLYITFYVCYYVIYGLCLRLTSSIETSTSATEKSNNKLVYNL